MADSSVPFALGAASVPAGRKPGRHSRRSVGPNRRPVSDLLSTDDPTSMTLAVKVSADASDLATTTILKTITQSLTAAGVITPTSDPTVWRAVFTLTRQEGVRISRSTTYEYSVVATVDRGGTDYSAWCSAAPSERRSTPSTTTRRWRMASISPTAPCTRTASTTNPGD
jgi:hypothetical protein